MFNNTSKTVVQLSIALALLASFSTTANSQGLRAAFDAQSQSGRQESRKLSAKEVYNKLLSATVWVRCSDGRHGTGWIYNKAKGLIITNHHVVRGVDTVKLFPPKFDQDNNLITDSEEYIKYTRPVIGKVIDSEIGKDLALIQVTSKLPAFTTQLKIADKSASPADRVHVVGGMPKNSQGVFDYANGHVRQVAKGRHSQPGIIWIIQTSIPTNPGNSGGAIVNDSAELVGVNSTGYGDAENVTGGTDVRELKSYLKTVMSLYPPKTADQNYKIGWRHYRSKRYNSATKYFTASLKLDPKNSACFRLRGYCYIAKRDLETARNDFDSAIKLNANDWDAYRGRAIAHRQSKNLKAAIKDISQAIRLNPTSKVAHYNRGEMNLDLRNYEQAVHDFNRSIDIDKKYDIAISERGYTYLKLGLYQHAVSDFQAAIKLRPSFNSYNNLGVAYKNLNQLDNAWNAYTMATKYNPKNYLAWQGLAEILIRKDQFNSAITYADYTLKLNTKSVRAMNVRAKAFFLTGKRNQSLQEINRAIKLAPSFVDLYETRWVILSKLGHQQDAAKDYKMLVKLDPKRFKNKTQHTVAKPVMRPTKQRSHQNQLTGTWMQQGQLNGVRYKAGINFNGNRYSYFVDWVDAGGKLARTDSTGTFKIGNHVLILTNRGGQVTKHRFGFNQNGDLTLEFPHVNISKFFVMKRVKK